MMGLNRTSVGEPAIFPRHDYVLIPCLSLLTLIAMFGVAEIGARALWSAEGGNSCAFRDAFGAPRCRPNCAATSKVPEGPLVTYHFNECGYRGHDPCGAKPAGVIRVALLGSSITEGLNVVESETFAERVKQELQKRTGRKVQVENLGLETSSPLYCYRRLGELIALRPDAVVYAVSPFDLDQRIDPTQLADRNNLIAHFSRPAAQAEVTPLKRLQETLNSSRAVLVAQHFMFADSERYLRLYLAYGDRADYLRRPLSGKWHARFADFNVVLTDMASRLRQEGVPMFVMAAPSRPEAALLNLEPRPPHTDPFAFGDEIKRMASTLHIEYVDAIAEFQATPHSDHLFYYVDQHITGEGHALLSRALMHKLSESFIAKYRTSNGE